MHKTGIFLLAMAVLLAVTISAYSEPGDEPHSRVRRTSCMFGNLGCAVHCIMRAFWYGGACQESLCYCNT